jgi:hypothetical protein
VTTRRRTTRSAGPLLVALAVCTTLATACGGGGRLSADEYVRRASAICRHANRRAEAASRPARRAAVQARTAAELEALRPPEAMAQFDAVWVALVRQSAAELAALVVSHRAGDGARAAQQREAVATLTARAAELARTQGITACPRHFTAADSASAASATVETGT